MIPVSVRAGHIEGEVTMPNRPAVSEIAPAALRRERAARYLDVSPGYFDKLVAEGIVPGPRRLGDGVRVWLRADLDDALYSLEPENVGGANSCDRVFG